MQKNVPLHFSSFKCFLKFSFFSLVECNGVDTFYFFDLILEAFFFRPSSINLCMTTVFLFDSGDTGAIPFLAIFLLKGYACYANYQFSI